MSNMYVDVATFIGACSQPKSEKNAELYKRLIEEEYGEFVFAEKNHDEIGELDALS